MIKGALVVFLFLSVLRIDQEIAQCPTCGGTEEIICSQCNGFPSVVKPSISNLGSQSWIQDRGVIVVGSFQNNEDFGVYGTLICDKDGLPLQSDMASSDAEALAAHVASLMGKVHGVAEEIERGELSFVNITLQEAEILIAPESDFTLVVLKKLLKKGRTPM